MRKQKKRDFALGLTLIEKLSWMNARGAETVMLNNALLLVALAHTCLKSTNEASNFKGQCSHLNNMGTQGKLRSRLL